MNSETKDGFPTPVLSSQSEIPDLSVPQYFFGGLSPGFEPRVPLPQPFLGCMSDLQITQETYNPFRGRNWGIQKTCSEKVGEREFFFENQDVVSKYDANFFLLVRVAGDNCRLQRKRIFRVGVICLEKDRLFQFHFFNESNQRVLNVEYYGRIRSKSLILSLRFRCRLLRESEL